MASHIQNIIKAEVVLCSGPERRTEAGVVRRNQTDGEVDSTLLFAINSIVDALNCIHLCSCGVSSLQERMRGSCVKESELAPIWSTNHTHCQLCDKKFSFFARKHHCRNW